MADFTSSSFALKNKMARSTTAVTVTHVNKRQLKPSAVNQHQQQMNDNSALNGISAHGDMQPVTINGIQIQSSIALEIKSTPFLQRAYLSRVPF